MSRGRNLMSTGAVVGLAFALGASLAPATASAQTISKAPDPTSATEHIKLPWFSNAARFVPGRVVVVWRDGVDPAEMRAAAARAGAVRVRPTPSLGVDVMKVADSASVGATIRNLRRSPLVRFAERDRIAQVEDATPNDPYFSRQWALNNIGQSHPVTDQGGTLQRSSGTRDADIDAPEAWAELTTHHEVDVAVIDTGVDWHHPDLQNQMWSGIGRDFYGHDDDPSPTGSSLENSHGTHVAGIIAAEQNNTTGIAGVCPDCRIMALRVGTANNLSLGTELKAIQFAIDNGARVINLSFGSPVWSAAERAAIAAAGRAGILVVAAAGNASADNDIPLFLNSNASAPTYPASYTLPNILSVAASNDRDEYGYLSQCHDLGLPTWRCGFTSWGHDSVDVAAPGVDIISTVAMGVGTFPSAGSNYAVFDGTSMAAPMVSGIAGLVLSEHPAYSPIRVKNAIMNSVDHPPSLHLYDAFAPFTKVGKRALTGRFTRTQGRVNAAAAINAETTKATVRTDGNIDGARRMRRSHVRGRVSWPADANDVYRKRLVGGERYRVTLDGPSGTDLDLWVWKPGTKEIAQFTAGCFVGRRCPALQAESGGPTADEQVTFRAARTGRYYIQVNGWYSGGRYRLRLQHL
jgi:subtilisin family serine protease